MVDNIKKIFIVLLTLTVSFSSQLLFGQEGQFNKGKAIYLTSINYKTGIPRVYDGELIFDENSSVFTYDKDTKEGEVKTERLDGDRKVTVISKGRSADNIGLVVYSDFTNEKTIERGFIQGRPFIISDTLQKIDWVLLDDIKDIDGIKSQKAKTNFYGREYEVWFANSIPIPYGPWKLQGLPGLILEARSTDGEISFELKKISPLIDQLEILPPSSGEVIAGYVNFYNLQNKKTNEFLKSTQSKVSEYQQSNVSVSMAGIKLKSNVMRIEKTSEP